MNRFTTQSTGPGETYVLDQFRDGETWCVCVGQNHKEKAERTARAMNFDERAHAGMKPVKEVTE